MTTTAPEAAAIHALAVYLQEALVGAGDLGDSLARESWVEPTESLELGPAKVVVAVVQSGATKESQQLGSAPSAAKIVTGAASGGVTRATVYWDHGIVEVPLTLGLWASTGALRDDVDDFLADALNKPYWTTVEVRASTTLSTALTAIGEQFVTPVDMTDIWPGTTLDIGTGATKERVVVSEIRATSFLATTRYLHSAAEAIVEVAGRNQKAARGLSLRCDQHHNAVALFVFEGRQTLDDAEGGKGRQRQEWRSLRQGRAYIRQLRTATGIVVQDSLRLKVYAEAGATLDGTPVYTRQIYP